MGIRDKKPTPRLAEAGKPGFAVDVRLALYNHRPMKTVWLETGPLGHRGLGIVSLKQPSVYATYFDALLAITLHCDHRGAYLERNDPHGRYRYFVTRPEFEIREVACA